MNRRRENIKFWYSTVIVSIAFTFLACFSHYVRHKPDGNAFRFLQSVVYYNNSPSTPRGIYIKIPMLWLARGDYVVYEPYEAVWDIASQRGWTKYGTPFLKRVRGLAGDEYRADLKDGFYVGNRYFGSIAILDGQGRLMPMHLGEYRVPPDNFLPVGENNSSFDGRYTGTVAKKNIRAKVIPLFTEAMIP